MTHLGQDAFKFAYPRALLQTVRQKEMLRLLFSFCLGRPFGSALVLLGAAFSVSSCVVWGGCLGQLFKSIGAAVWASSFGFVCGANSWCSTIHCAIHCWVTYPLFRHVCSHVP